MQKIILTTVVIILTTYNCAWTQYIDNKLDLVFSYGILSPIGSKDINESNFVTPSLFNNYQNGQTFAVRIAYNYRPNLSLGLEITSTQFDNWSYDELEFLYCNSSTASTSIAPLIKFQTMFRKHTVLNRLQVYGILAPSLNFTTVSLAREIFQIEPSPPESVNMLESSFSSLGGSAYIGGAYSITQEFSVFVESGMHYTVVTGQLYNDKNLFTVNLSIGFTVKLFKDKRFYL